MTTCPWCGISYNVYQSVCQKCGGPIPVPITTPLNVGAKLPSPPPAPRPFADNFVRKLIFSEGWTISSFVFILIGVIVTITGILLILGIVTGFAGLPFVAVGILFLVVGGVIFNKIYQKAHTTARVLRDGQAMLGQIISVNVNEKVRVKNRNPWTIRYTFQVNGKTYKGQVTTLNKPGPTLHPSRSVYVLYLPDAPQNNSMYPHP